MQKTHQTTIPANQVMALFADRVRSFSLARGATFADLADRLDQPGGWDTDMPQAISLKFGAARQPIPVAQPATWHTQRTSAAL
jgi:hypothetical protein